MAANKRMPPPIIPPRNAPKALRSLFVARLSGLEGVIVGLDVREGEVTVSEDATEVEAVVPVDVAVVCVVNKLDAVVVGGMLILVN